MGMWFNTSTDQTLRWDYRGLALATVALIVIGLYSIAAKARPQRESNQLNGKAIDVVAVQQED
jgi:hypothetical protein